MAKKYRILQSFVYRGKDGKSTKPITLGPGEEVPELDSNERTRLLKQEIICETSQDGENIRYKKLIDLTDEQIDNLLRKPKSVIIAELNNVIYSKDTLSRIYAVADSSKQRPDKVFFDFLEQKIAGEV